MTKTARMTSTTMPPKKTRKKTTKISSDTEERTRRKRKRRRRRKRVEMKTQVRKEKKLKELKKFVPPFWLGKPKPGGGQYGGGNQHVEQVGWIINNQANTGGWGVWPSSWNTPNGVDHSSLKWVDGKGWTGSVGAPWRQAGPHDWGPGYVRHEEEDEGKGKKGKKGKKDKKKKKKKKKGKKKKKKKKKKKGGDDDPCKPGGGGGGKKGRSMSLLREARHKKDKDKGDKKDKKDKKGKKKKKKKGAGGGGWVKDPCDRGPKPWFGWPQKIKFIPPPPRGSQIWLNHGSPKPVKSGWSDHHGWNWKKKLTSGWGVSDLIGVVHL